MRRELASPLRWLQQHFDVVSPVTWPPFDGWSCDSRLSYLLSRWSVSHVIGETTSQCCWSHSDSDANSVGCSTRLDEKVSIYLFLTSWQSPVTTYIPLRLMYFSGRVCSLNKHVYFSNVYCEPIGGRIALKLWRLLGVSCISVKKNQQMWGKMRASLMIS